jgi:hypothetical protein
MMKTGVQSAGVNQVRHAQLLDVPEPLKIRVSNQIKYERRGDIYKAVDGIIDDFLFVQSYADKLYGTKIAIFIDTLERERFF